MKKGNPIRIEELEVGKAYSLFGGMSYFIVIEKNEKGLMVEYPKNKQKTTNQEFLFEKYQDRVTNDNQPVQYRFQERYSITVAPR